MVHAARAFHPPSREDPVKRRKIWLFMAAILTAGWLGTLLGGCQLTRAGYESAPYKVVRAEGRFELRDYPALTLVETPMTDSRRDGSDGSFMRLFNFITGANAAGQKIAMTTPVFMSGEPTNAAMAFVMPASLTTATVPRPTAGTVTVRESSAGRFAVLRFRGGRSAMREAEVLAELRTWLTAQALQSSATPVFGYFDPPWTPAPLRRNEVMLRLAVAP